MTLRTGDETMLEELAAVSAAKGEGASHAHGGDHIMGCPDPDCTGEVPPPHINGDFDIM